MASDLPPEYWRARAEETRLIADQMSLLETRDVLLKIAEDYEKLARMAEDMQRYRAKR